MNPTSVSIPESTLFWLLQTLAKEIDPGQAGEAATSIRILEETLPALTHDHAAVVVGILARRKELTHKTGVTCFASEIEGFRVKYPKRVP